MRIKTIQISSQSVYSAAASGDFLINAHSDSIVVLINAEASLEASLRELAAVVKLQCTATQIPQRRQSTEHECSNAKQSEDA